MLLKMYNDSPSNRNIEIVVDIFNKGGVVIFPTDTVYAMGCDLNNKKALNKLANLKGIKLKKAHFSIISHDISSLSAYVRQIDRSTFKLLNRSLPGPFCKKIDRWDSPDSIFTQARFSRNALSERLDRL